MAKIKLTKRELEHEQKLEQARQRALTKRNQMLARFETILRKQVKEMSDLLQQANVEAGCAEGSSTSRDQVFQLLQDRLTEVMRGPACGGVHRY